MPTLTALPTHINTTDRLEIEGTLTMPRILFDAKLGMLSMEGKCIPENAGDFFQPVVHWVEAYLRKPRPFTNIIFKLEYFNTSTSKYILEITRRFERMTGSNEHSVLVSWYCEPGDTDMEEAGLDYRSILHIPFEVLTVTDSGEVLHRVPPVNADKGAKAAENDGPASNGSNYAEHRTPHVPEHTQEEFELVSSVSDRLQNKLNHALEKLKSQSQEINAINGRLELRNNELSATIEALTNAKAGRRATTIALIIALVLFLTSEAIEYWIELYTQNVLHLGWILAIKLCIALLIKPIESILESYFIKRGALDRRSTKK